MTYVYKQYESKIKMVQEQRQQLNMKFFLYNMKIVISWEVMNLWWGK